jgi:hypothetical protein
MMGYLKVPPHHSDSTARHRLHSSCLPSQMPSKRPAYREDRSHVDFLAEISGVLPAHRRDPAHFEAALQRQVDAFFQQQQQQQSPADTAVGVAISAPAIASNHDIVDSFLQDRGGAGSQPIGKDELAALYAELATANPQFIPRTFEVDDLQTLLEHHPI